MNDRGQPEATISIIEQHTDSGVRLLLSGEIDLATVGQIRDAVTDLLTRDNPSAIVLDLKDVSFIDSSGMGELVRCHQAAAVSGGVLRLENLAPFPHRQLWATGLLGLFGLADIPGRDEILMPQTSGISRETQSTEVSSQAATRECHD
ncbi:STAS domain-containing protein [Plantactinospora sp. KLBMP9567]|uniref:STAS domain-containing protein n=1 Tax=Plantactinospora sp. KLBMP9567 TaxID=3085900 RepID=UPI00298249BA|nr:STAS domain-containing protein [Plantactinospora sp. KLBMP9567]MDW5329682.1 STAS domain-containing protein [Plantactinospora sp. KLBMP9567]